MEKLEKLLNKKVNPDLVKMLAILVAADFIAIVIGICANI